MPDQTRSVVNTTLSSLSDPIHINKKIIPRQQEQQSDYRLAPITSAILQQQNNPNRSSPRIIRRYSKPQGDSCDTDSDPNQESSVDGDQEDIFILQKFHDSVEGTHLARRRSSPELFPDLGRIDFSSSNLNNNSSSSSSTAIDTIDSSADSTSNTPPVASRKTVDYPRQAPAFPSQGSSRSILSKMVGSRMTSQQQQQQQQNVDNAVSQSSSTTLLPSKSCPKFHIFEDDYHHNQYVDIYSVQNDPSQSGAMIPCQPKSNLIPSIDSSSNRGKISIDSVDGNSSASSSSASGFGFLFKTRQFGTWLGFSSDASEKMEVSKKDLNVFAPTTF